jgi:hypothetical protein
MQVNERKDKEGRNEGKAVVMFIKLNVDKKRHG